MIRKSLLLLFVCILFVNTNLFAQTDNSPNLVLSAGNDNSVKIDNSSLLGDGQILTITVAEILQLNITCIDTVDCSSFNVSLIGTGDSQGIPGTTVGAPTSTQSIWRFLPEQLASKTDPSLVIRPISNDTPGKEMVIIPLAGPSQRAQPAPSSNLGAATGPIRELLTTDCSSQLRRIQRRFKRSAYNAKENKAYFVVSPIGNVYVRPGAVIDEDDIVNVLVVADRGLINLLRIERTSAFRTPGTLSILGENVALPSEIIPKSTGSQREAICDIKEFPLTDFQPGQATVDLTIVGPKTDFDAGSFDFGINTLYSGAFSLGVAYSFLENSSYGVVASGNDTLLTKTEDGRSRGLYTLMYTPFLGKKRDLEKDTGLHISPTVGIVLNDIDENILVGLTGDYSSMIYFSAGLHAGRVNRLNEQSGAEVGKSFTLPESEIPVVRAWRGHFFFGVTLDLRVATQLVGKVFTPGG